MGDPGRDLVGVMGSVPRFDSQMERQALKRLIDKRIRFLNDRLDATLDGDVIWRKQLLAQQDGLNWVLVMLRQP